MSLADASFQCTALGGDHNKVTQSFVFVGGTLSKKINN